MKGGAEIYKPPTILSRFRANQACLARTRDAWAAPRKKKTFPSGCNSCLTLISRGEGEEGGKKGLSGLQAVSTMHLLGRYTHLVHDTPRHGCTVLLS